MDVLKDITSEMCRREYELNSELESMSEELSERYEELNLVYDMENLNRVYGLKDEIFNKMIKLCANYMDVDMAFFVMPEKQHIFQAVNPGNEEVDINLIREKIQSKVYPFVTVSRKAIIINKKTDQRRELIFNDLPYRILAVPVIIREQVTAILVILKHEERKNFTNSDRNLVEVVTSQASILLQNQQMYSEMQLFTKEMAAALIESIDAKDPYTRGHSDRVNFYSVEIGKTMGLSETNVKNLYWASLLHDLGKIGVPDAILRKAGKLTEDEYTFIKTHPEKGYTILRYVKHLREALPGVRHHHERYDGKGFPHGLAGKEIPIHARIISVADTYDAITSTRSYRPARTHEEAMNEIKKVSGTQLDQKIVNIWIQVVNTRKDFFQTNNATVMNEK